MLDKLRLRNQRQPAPKEPDRGPSNSLPICWDFPLGRKKLEAFINRTVSQRDKIAMERVSDELQESQAEARLYKLSQQSAMEALRHEKKERKRTGSSAPKRRLLQRFRRSRKLGKSVMTEL